MLLGNGLKARSRDGGLYAMKRTLLWLIVVAALVIAFVFYRSRPRYDLNVDPHTREELEKAMRH